MSRPPPWRYRTSKLLPRSCPKGDDPSSLSIHLTQTPAGEITHTNSNPPWRRLHWGPRRGKGALARDNRLLSLLSFLLFASASSSFGHSGRCMRCMRPAIDCVDGPEQDWGDNATLRLALLYPDLRFRADLDPMLRPTNESICDGR